MDPVPQLAPDRAEPRGLGGGFRKTPDPTRPDVGGTNGPLTPQQVGALFVEVSRQHRLELAETEAAAYAQALIDLCDELGLSDVAPTVTAVTDAIRQRQLDDQQEEDRHRDAAGD